MPAIIAVMTSEITVTTQRVMSARKIPMAIAAIVTGSVGKPETSIPVRPVAAMAVIAVSSRDIWQTIAKIEMQARTRIGSLRSSKANKRKHSGNERKFFEGIHFRLLGFRVPQRELHYS